MDVTTDSLPSDIFHAILLELNGLFRGHLAQLAAHLAMRTKIWRKTHPRKPLVWQAYFVTIGLRWGALEWVGWLLIKEISGVLISPNLGGISLTIEGAARTLARRLSLDWRGSPRPCSMWRSKK